MPNSFFLGHNIYPRPKTTSIRLNDETELVPEGIGAVVIRLKQVGVRNKGIGQMWEEQGKGKKGMILKVA